MGPSRGAFTLDDVGRRSPGLLRLVPQDGQSSPITVRKITIGGDVKVKGVWTSPRVHGGGLPRGHAFKNKNARRVLEIPEKDECDEEPVVVEEPTPKRAPPPYAPKVPRNASVRASLQCRLGYARAVAWASPHAASPLWKVPGLRRR